MKYKSHKIITVTFNQPMACLGKNGFTYITRIEVSDEIVRFMDVQGHTVFKLFGKLPAIAIDLSEISDKITETWRNHFAN